MQYEEYRIVLPIKLDDYPRGHIYTAAQATLKADTESKGNDGITILKKEQYFDDQMGKNGTYCKRVYDVATFLPGWISAILPEDALRFYEESRYCFPKIETIVTNTWLGDRLVFRIDSLHATDFGTTENIHGLTEEQLKSRKVYHIDIGNFKSDRTEYNPSEDPSLIKIEKKNLGPLNQGWQEKLEDGNYMCCYKLVTAKIGIWGIQSRSQNYLFDFERDLLARVHQMIYCSIDQWCDLSAEEIAKIEETSEEKMLQRRTIKN